MDRRDRGVAAMIAQAQRLKIGAAFLVLAVAIALWGLLP